MQLPKHYAALALAIVMNLASFKASAASPCGDDLHPTEPKVLVPLDPQYCEDFNEMVKDLSVKAGIEPPEVFVTSRESPTGNLSTAFNGKGEYFLIVSNRDFELYGDHIKGLVAHEIGHIVFRKNHPNPEDRNDRRAEEWYADSIAVTLGEGQNFIYCMHDHQHAEQEIMEFNARSFSEVTPYAELDGDTVVLNLKDKLSL
ncbi:MAG: hypothetical protein P8P30_02055 [Rickettsiales bacterium]|nr:hypothetical protein [Rickettsiales bacterium]